MSLQHFFLDNQVIGEEQDETFALRLDAADMKHARVLRLAPGEHLAVIDAASDYFECEVVSFSGDLVVRIAHRGETEQDLPTVMLLQGLSKGDKMDAVVRHATELGVAAFVPLVCERSVVKLDAKKSAERVNRWHTIAKSAAMQSGQHAIPEIAQLTNVPQASSMVSGATCVLVCWEEADSTNIKQAIAQALESTQTSPADARVAVVVGPEGGLTQHEVDRFLSASDHAYAVTLGRSILRTETAGVVAPALALFELGGLQ